MAPASSSCIRNTYPEDLLLEIAQYLQPHDVRAFMLCCNNYHYALAPSLYRDVHVDVPLVSFPTEDIDGPFRLLCCLVTALQHYASHPSSPARCYPRYIRSLTYLSYDHTADLRAIPMLAMVLSAATSLRHIQLDVPQSSVDFLVNLFRRRFIIRSPLPSVLAAFSKQRAIPHHLPLLDSVRSTKLEVVTGLMEARRLSTVVVDFAHAPTDLYQFLPQPAHACRDSLTRLCIAVVGHPSQFCLMIRGIAATFPRLQHLALRCGTKLAGTLVDEHYIFPVVEVVTINYGGRRGDYQSKLDVDSILRLRCLNVNCFLGIDAYMSRAWSIDKTLDRWFYRVKAFLAMLDQCDAIVSGSEAQQHFAQHQFRGNDLDIYVPCHGLLQLGRWLRNEGYIYQPSGGKHDFFDAAAVMFVAATASGRNPAGAHDFQTFTVFNFYRPRTHILRLLDMDGVRIQLIAVRGDPIKFLLYSFHSTGVMNFFTGTYAASAAAVVIMMYQEPVIFQTRITIKTVYGS
ncbi:hypothetical protein FKP32DRAFT_1681576 [Trametes sanguinea]|nr:hypothetical protein FKP32DRAFT_1681576 [Trametes sanguinea]